MAKKPGSDGLFGADYTVKPKDVLSAKFTYPPFTILNAREGWWQERKRQWIALGIKGELGRGFYTQEGNAFGTSLGNSGDLNKKYKDSSPGGSPRPAMNQAGHKKGQPIVRGDGHGRPLVRHAKGLTFNAGMEDIDEYRNRKAGTPPDENDVVGGTSIFDPVLAELMFRWFCPDGGHVLDPFAGESTKGIVATTLDYDYTGCELRPEQVAANREQAKRIGVKPTWVNGDSSKLDSLLPKGKLYDFVWTSPPYYDLEIYSKSEKDGSAFETYPKFIAWYRDIFAQAVGRLKDNRFVAVKVGEIRDDSGAYYNFVGDNISCFMDLGLHYYNEAILVTAVGSLPLRINKQFGQNRKLGKSHQNILVFYKGDMKRIKDEFRNLAEGQPALAGA